MNDPRFPFMHDSPSFFHQRFHDTFGSDLDMESGKEHRVHHIPIHIEPRNSQESSNVPGNGEIQRNQQQSPLQSVYNQNYPQGNPTAQSQLHQTQPINVSPMQQSANSNEFNSASPRVIPIQICKSSSSPSAATNEKTIPIQRVPKTQPASSPQQSQSNSALNDSASLDPISADPNKVYAMTYTPLAKPEDSKKLPEVVPLAYEPQIACKQANMVKMAANNNNENENHSKLQNAVQQTQEPLPSSSQEPQETSPFDLIDLIMNDLKIWEQEVNKCNVTSADDKSYLLLDEMLTKCILRLDCININGNDELRKYRKQAINEVNKVTSLLESKIHTNNEAENNECCNDDEAKSPTEVTDNCNESLAQPSQSNTDKQTSNDKKDSKKDKKKDGGGKRLFFFKKNNQKQDSTSNVAAEPKPEMDRNNNNLQLIVSGSAGDILSEQDKVDKDNVKKSSSAIILPGRETAV